MGCMYNGVFNTQHITTATTKDVDVAQLADYLPNIHKALASIPQHHINGRGGMHGGTCQ